jgi:hypothetical protein
VSCEASATLIRTSRGASASSETNIPPKGCETRVFTPISEATV